MASSSDESILGQIGFKEKIQDIGLSDILPNALNPRQRFSEDELDELLVSIDSKGLLNPLIVFKEGSKFRLIDGQRRYECAKRLKLKKVPVHILKRPPTELENISLMFHIHNVREEWTEIAIALSIQKIISEIGTKNIGQIAKITSLSEYKLRKYLKILDYPKEVIDKFLKSEKEYLDLDVDMLAELHQPLKRLEKEMPYILEKHGIEEIVEVFINKKKRGEIKKNKEFRKLSKIISAGKKGQINMGAAQNKILELIENESVTIEDVYSDTAETAEQATIIKRKCDKIIEDIENIDLRKLGPEDKNELFKKMKRVLSTISKKIRD